MQDRHTALAQRVSEELTNGDDNIDYHVRLEKLITNLVAELGSDNLAARVTAQSYPADITQFEENLNVYGDEGDRKLFNKHDLIESYSPYKSYRVIWSAQYELFLSMMSRLQSANLVQLAHVSSKHNNAIIHYIPGHSLKFAWIEVPVDTSDKNIQPFLVYCAKQITNKKTDILRFIKSKKLTSEQCVEIGVALCAYHATVSRFDRLEVGEAIVKVMQEFMSLDHAMQMPACELLKIYLQVSDVKVKDYVTAHKRPDEIRKLLPLLSEEEAAKFMMYLYGEKVRKITSFSLIELAAEAGKVQAVTQLLGLQKNSAAFRAMNTKALSSAAIEGHAEVVSILQESGRLNMKKLPNEGLELAREALAKEYFDIAFMLVRSGVNMDREQEYTDTLLHAGARRGDNELVNAVLLCLDKSRIDWRDAQGETALLVAVNGNHVGVAQLLLQFGANPGGALAIAVQKSQVDMVALLLAYHTVPANHHKPVIEASMAIAEGLQFPEIRHLLELKQLNFAIEFDSSIRDAAFNRLIFDVSQNPDEFNRLYDIFATLTNYIQFLNLFENSGDEKQQIVSRNIELIADIHEAYSETGELDAEMLLELSASTAQLVKAVQREENAFQISVFGLFNLFRDSLTVTKLKGIEGSLQLYAQDDMQVDDEPEDMQMRDVEEVNTKEPEGKRVKFSLTQ